MSVIRPEIPPQLPPLRILIVDDEQTIRVTLTLCLEADGHAVTSVASAHAALEEISRHSFDLVFLDLRLGLDNGLNLIPRFRRENPWCKIVVITAYASVETAVEAMKRGATDYLSKPFTPVEVQLVTQKVAQRRQLEWQVEALREALGNLDPEADFHTSSAAMQQALNLARQVASSNANVLICGEIGTGKSRLARAIHAWSPRAHAPISVVSCQRTSADALEAEIFGAGSAGDSTGEDSPGRVAFCQSGTLVLDEVGQTPPSLQPKLLRLISEKEYERLGDFRVRSANVRFVATSSIDLDAAAKRNRFRPELLLALDVVRIDLAPLRERPEDVKLLARRYLAFYSRENYRPIAGFHPDAMYALTRHSWPGNSRELQNVVERAALLCNDDYVTVDHLPPNLIRNEKAYSVGDLVPLETIEGQHIRGVLASTGTIKGAAAILGINPSTLARRIKKSEQEGAAGTMTEGSSASSPGSGNDQPAR